MARIPVAQPASITNLPPLVVSEIERTGNTAGRVAFQAGQAASGAFQAVQRDLENKVIATQEMDFRQRLTELRLRSREQPDADMMRVTFDEGSDALFEEIVGNTPQNLQPVVANQLNRSLESARISVHEQSLARRRGEAMQRHLSHNDTALRALSIADGPDEQLEIIEQRREQIMRDVKSGVIYPSDGQSIERAFKRQAASNMYRWLIQNVPMEARDIADGHPFIQEHLGEAERIFLEPRLERAELEERHKITQGPRIGVEEALDKGYVYSDKEIQSMRPAELGGNDIFPTESRYLAAHAANEANKRRTLDQQLALEIANQALYGDGIIDPRDPKQMQAASMLFEMARNTVPDWDALPAGTRGNIYAATIDNLGDVVPPVVEHDIRSLVRSQNATNQAEGAVIFSQIQENIGVAPFSASPREKAKIAFLARFSRNGIEPEAALAATTAALERNANASPEATRISLEREVEDSDRTNRDFLNDSELADIVSRKAVGFGESEQAIAEALKSFDIEEEGEDAPFGSTGIPGRVAAQLGRITSEFEQWGRTMGESTFTGFRPPPMPEEMYEQNEDLVEFHYTLTHDLPLSRRLAAADLFDPKGRAWGVSFAAQYDAKTWMPYAPEDFHPEAGFRNRIRGFNIRSQMLEDAVRSEGPKVDPTRVTLRSIPFEPMRTFRDAETGRTWRQPVYQLWIEGDPTSIDPNQRTSYPIVKGGGAPNEFFYIHERTEAAQRDADATALKTQKARTDFENSRKAHQDAIELAQKRREEGVDPSVATDPLALLYVNPAAPFFQETPGESGAAPSAQAKEDLIYSPHYQAYVNEMLDRVAGDPLPKLHRGQQRLIQQASGQVLDEEGFDANFSRGQQLLMRLQQGRQVETGEIP